jgi:phosphoglycolate phosphatase-like HAD superfamily hydrolase
MKKKSLVLSNLNKTWIFDLDGTLVKHNGYKDSGDALLPGVKEMLNLIPQDDFIIILTARPYELRGMTEVFLKKNEIRYNEIIFNVPCGERILFNDSKPSGLKMAYAIEGERDSGLEHVDITIDDAL